MNPQPETIAQLIGLRAFDSAKGTYYYAYFRDPKTDRIDGFRVDPEWVDLESEVVQRLLITPQEWGT